MTSRAGLHLFTNTTRQSQTHTFIRDTFRSRNVFRRHQTTTAAPAETQSFAQRMWTSPVGVKTVHFWAPVMKWGVVLAGAADFLRPAEKLSLPQNAALLATGSLWTRWCFVIRPQNMLLAAVNACLFCVGLIQCSRILNYQREQTGSYSNAFSAMFGSVKDAAKDAEKEVEKEAHKATA